MSPDRLRLTTSLWGGRNMAGCWPLYWNTLNDEDFSLLYSTCSMGAGIWRPGSSSLFWTKLDFYGFNSAAFDIPSFSLDIFVFLVETDAHSWGNLVSFSQSLLPKPSIWFLGSGVLWILSVRQLYEKLKPKQTSCPCSGTQTLIW